VVTVVRFDVVDHDGSRHQPLAFAEHAQWMLREIIRPRLLPCRGVTALTRRAATPVEVASLLGLISMASRTMKRSLTGIRTLRPAGSWRVLESSILRDCEMTFDCAGLRFSSLLMRKAVPDLRLQLSGIQLVFGAVDSAAVASL
jgi:hypothetical protein